MFSKFMSSPPTICKNFFDNEHLFVFCLNIIAFISMSCQQFKEKYFRKNFDKHDNICHIFYSIIYKYIIKKQTVKRPPVF